MDNHHNKPDHNKPQAVTPSLPDTACELYIIRDQVTLMSNDMSNDMFLVSSGSSFIIHACKRTRSINQ